MEQTKQDAAERALVLLIAAGAAGYAWSFQPFLCDDALISLRYARRLLDGHGLTWTDGPPVEGYSNLAWVLLTALLGRLGIDLVLAARLLGAAGTALAALALFAVPVTEDRRQAGSGRLLALLLYGLSASTAAWALAGLEQPLVAASLAWAMVGVLRLLPSAAPRAAAAIAPGLCFALLCLSRPDSPLFVICAAVALVLSWRARGERIAWRPLLVLAGLPLLAYAAQTAFRLAYYGEWVANTALVKAHPNWAHARSGYDYVQAGVVAMWPLFAGLLLGIAGLLKSGRRGTVLALLLPLTVWLAYVIAIGRDLFPAFRHFAPVVTLAALAVAEGAGALLGPWHARRSLAAALALPWAQSRSIDVRQAHEERWEWPCRDLALLLKAGFGAQQPLMAVTAAGCLPYWSGFPAIDMLGLNDWYLPRHPPPGFGSGPLGHELGSGDYIWSRKPDLIVYHLGWRDDPFRSGQELARMPEFCARYLPAVLQVPSTPAFEATIWIDRDSPRLGLRNEGGRLHVPGYLVSGNVQTRVVALADGRLAMRVLPGQTALAVIPQARWPQGEPRVGIAGGERALVQVVRVRNGDLFIGVRNPEGPLDIGELVLAPGTADAAAPP